MIAIRTILLPMDGSECSRQALAYALEIARRHDARLVAFHVVDRLDVERIRRTLQLAGLPEERLTALLKRNEAEACAFLSEAVEAGQRSGVAVDTTWVTGSPADDIVQFAKEIKADLIVMGTHGRRGMSHLLLGSVAERVIRTAQCPVLTVRGETRDAAESPSPAAEATSAAALAAERK